MPLFPYKLHELLTEMQSNDRLSSIISWTQSGNAFKIHEPLLFEEILLQKYFPRQTQINSFKRQLLYYGYDNLGNGIFAHPCFLKDKRHLCGQINHTNPTKSQREGKALILSRRIRGKRAKHALRQRLEVPATSTKASTTITKKEEAERSIAGAAALDSRDHSPTSVTTSPAVPTTLSLATFSPGVIPMALASNGRLGGSQQSSMDTMPFHSPREMPNQYWSRLKTFKAPLTRMVSSDFAKEAKHLPGTAAGVSMFPPLNDESTLDLTREVVSMFPQMNHRTPGGLSQIDRLAMLFQRHRNGSNLGIGITSETSSVTSDDAYFFDGAGRGQQQPMTLPRRIYG